MCLWDMTMKSYKGQKNVLFISQDKAPQQTFNNPQLFPQMFPHLFPYGYGGVQNKLHKGRLSSINHKKWMLQYYDKQFQLDGIFPLIALNIEQIKNASNAGYMLANRKNVDKIAQHFKNIDRHCLEELVRKIKTDNGYNTSG